MPRGRPTRSEIRQNNAELRSASFAECQEPPAKAGGVNYKFMRLIKCRWFLSTSKTARPFYGLKVHGVRQEQFSMFHTGDY